MKLLRLYACDCFLSNCIPFDKFLRLLKLKKYLYLEENTGEVSVSASTLRSGNTTYIRPKQAIDYSIKIHK